MSRRVLTALALGAVLVTGTGCGVNGTDLRPGVAAQVGDTRIYTGEIDDAADKACDYFTQEGSGDPFPKSQLRGELLQLVTQQAALEQLLDDEGVDAPTVPDSAVQGFLDERFPNARGSQVDGLEVGAEAVLEAQTGLSALGAKLLADEGQPVDPAQPDVAFQRGLDELNAWMLDNDVDLNPVYGIVVGDDGALSADADDTSVVVSDEARYGALPDAEEQPSAEQQADRTAYLESLPADQVCG